MKNAWRSVRFILDCEEKIRERDCIWHTAVYDAFRMPWWALIAHRRCCLTEGPFTVSGIGKERMGLITFASRYYTNLEAEFEDLGVEGF